MTWADGSTFRGMWKNDKRLEGEMLMFSGNIYHGAFDEDQFNGHGQLLMQSGMIFEGLFQHGVCASVGKILYPNGDVYFGQHQQ